MAARKVYHIMPHEGGWQVRGEGAKRASGVLQTRDEAVERARELARKHEQWHIKVHRPDGSLEQEHTSDSAR